jgi:ABC-type siderophore export system fused ATPase/permease subunit
MTPTHPPSSPDVRPTLRQALATLFGGILLAATTCAGFWATLDLENESAVSIVMFLLFVLGLLAAVVGVVLVVLRQARVIAARRRAKAAGDAGR